MKECYVHNNSIRFARTIYATLALIAYFSQNMWLVLIVALAMTIGAFSANINIPYQIYLKCARKLFKDQSEPFKRDFWEMVTSCSVASIFLFISFFLLYFDKWTGFAWSLVLMISFLSYLAGLAGFCLASLAYSLGKKAIRKK